jgi:hypothetical protein
VRGIGNGKREMGKAYRSDDIIIEKSVGMKRDQTTPMNNCRAFGFSNKLKEPVNRKRKVAYRATNSTNPCKLQIKHHFFFV